MKFYRYEMSRIKENLSSNVLDINLSVEVVEFNLIHETTKGYRILLSFFDVNDKESVKCFSRWVSKTAKKRYAYPTKKEALFAFIKRHEHRVKIIQNQLNDSNAVLKIAEKMYNNIDNV